MIAFVHNTDDFTCFQNLSLESGLNATTILLILFPFLWIGLSGYYLCRRFCFARYSRRLRTERTSSIPMVMFSHEDTMRLHNEVSRLPHYCVDYYLMLHFRAVQFAWKTLPSAVLFGRWLAITAFIETVSIRGFWITPTFVQSAKDQSWNIGMSMVMLLRIQFHGPLVQKLVLLSKKPRDEQCVSFGLHRSTSFRDPSKSRISSALPFIYS